MSSSSSRPINALISARVWSLRVFFPCSMVPPSKEIPQTKSNSCNMRGCTSGWNRHDGEPGPADHDDVNRNRTIWDVETRRSPGMRLEKLRRRGRRGSSALCMTAIIDQLVPGRAVAGLETMGRGDATLRPIRSGRSGGVPESAF